jgi:DNA-binding response OmpR family regulator
MNSNNKIKILVVDDSDIILKILKEYFKVYSVEIVTSINGLDGIKKAIDVKPDLILLDLMMPNFDGLKTLQVVKVLDELKNIPVIVISSNTDKINVLSAIEAGADQVLAKPLKKEVLINAVEIALGKSLTPGLNNQTTSEIVTDLNEETTDKLKKLFLEKYQKEKSAINRSLQNKDAEFLKRFSHNAKTVGQAISYPQLSNINSELENLLNDKEINWQIINIKFNQVFAIIKDIENSILIWDN